MNFFYTLKNYFKRKVDRFNAPTYLEAVEGMEELADRIRNNSVVPTAQQYASAQKGTVVLNREDPEVGHKMRQLMEAGMLPVRISEIRKEVLSGVEVVIHDVPIKKEYLFKED